MWFLLQLLAVVSPLDNFVFKRYVDGYLTKTHPKLVRLLEEVIHAGGSIDDSSLDRVEIEASLKAIHHSNSQQQDIEVSTVLYDQTYTQLFDRDSNLVLDQQINQYSAQLANLPHIKVTRPSLGQAAKGLPNQNSPQLLNQWFNQGSNQLPAQYTFVWPQEIPSQDSNQGSKQFQDQGANQFINQWSNQRPSLGSLQRPGLGSNEMDSQWSNDQTMHWSNHQPNQGSNQSPILGFNEGLNQFSASYTYQYPNFDYSMFSNQETNQLFEQGSIDTTNQDTNEGSNQNLQISGITKEQKQHFLDLHNQYRSRVARGLVNGQPSGSNIVLLEWSDVAAAGSFNLASQCSGSHSSTASRQFAPYRWVGENIMSFQGMNFTPQK